MEIFNPQSPQSTCPNTQQSSKTEPSADLQCLDVLELPNTSNSVVTSTLDTSPTYFQRENEYIDKTNDIQGEEYQALFSAPIKDNRSSKSFYSQDNISLSPSTGNTPKRDKEAVNELSLILVECMDKINTRSRELLLRKFYAEVEREERLERFIVERLRESKVKAIKELCQKFLENEEETEIDEKGNDDVPTRGLSDYTEESSNKLERFKVKTFEIGGAVVDEVKKQL